MKVTSLISIMEVTVEVGYRFISYSSIQKKKKKRRRRHLVVVAVTAVFVVMEERN
jgi:hypothetical protein